MHKKKILLTGASDTIGKEILNLLYKKKDHYEISLLLRDSKKNNKLIVTFSILIYSLIKLLYFCFLKLSRILGRY